VICGPVTTEIDGLNQSMLFELHSDCTSFLGLWWDPCTSYEFSFHSRYWKWGLHVDRKFDGKTVRYLLK